MVSAGEAVQATGSWTNDRDHGLQFRAEFLRVSSPTTTEGIEKYLGSGMIRGIGPVYARKLVSAFAADVFDVRLPAAPVAVRDQLRSMPSAPVIVRLYQKQSIVLA